MFFNVCKRKSVQLQFSHGKIASCRQVSSQHRKSFELYLLEFQTHESRDNTLIVSVLNMVFSQCLWFYNYYVHCIFLSSNVFEH